MEPQFEELVDEIARLDKLLRAKQKELRDARNKCGHNFIDYVPKSVFENFGQDMIVCTKCGEMTLRKK